MINYRIALDARTIAHRDAITGIGTVTFLLANYLDRHGIGCDLFYDQKPTLSFNNHRPVVLASRSRPVWEQILLPVALRQRKVDLYHALWNHGLPVLRWPLKTVVTIHDLIPYDYPPEITSLKNRLWWHYYYSAVQFAAENSDAIISDSNHTSERIQHYFPQTTSKIVRIFPGVDSIFFERFKLVDTSLIKKYGLSQPYFLYYGGLDPRKNISSLLYAFSKMPEAFQLAIVGKQNTYYQELVSLVSSLSLKKRVHFTGYAKLEDLPQLIYSATGIVYPSTAEGFGYPVAESMAVGTPIITTPLPSIQEITGQEAYYFKPRDIDGLTKHMLSVANLSTGERANKSQRLRRLAQKFTAEAMVEEILRLYLNLLVKATKS